MTNWLEYARHKFAEGRDTCIANTDEGNLTSVLAVREPESAPDSDDVVEWYEERVAIVQHCGLLPVDEAEFIARECAQRKFPQAALGIIFRQNSAK